MTLSLDSIFDNVAVKRLAAVDLPDYGSNQHEVNGIAPFRRLFGTENRIEIEDVRWYYFSDANKPVVSTGSATFYDARENDPNRTEWRFYYNRSGASVLQFAEPEDILLLIKSQQVVYGLVFEKDSNWLDAAQHLFQFSIPGRGTHILPEEKLKKQITFVVRRILDELEIDIELPVIADDEELVREKFGMKFPSTRDMSDFARQQIEVDINNPDETLIRWIEREEELFRALEKLIVEKRLERPFETVDEFISFSLSVQNRRKSRMGYALENQLKALFDAHNLNYTHDGKTEGNKKPDFMFPDIEAYHNPAFDTSLLTMLGAKSTCKDRWRQVLSEADRISDKHLCTLEPGISSNQTDEMKDNQLTLVVPVPLHETYDTDQLHDILSLKMFINLIKERKKRISFS